MLLQTNDVLEYNLAWATQVHAEETQQRGDTSVAKASRSMAITYRCMIGSPLNPPQIGYRNER